MKATIKWWCADCKMYTGDNDAEHEARHELFKPRPIDGGLRIKWYTAQAQAEQCGELVTIEQWDEEAQGWAQHGLDAHDTVQDLIELKEILK